MKVTVRVFGDLAEVVGNRHEMDLDIGTDVKGLTKKIAEKTGQHRQGYLGEYRVGGNELAVLVNGRNIDLMEGIRTTLKDGDEVVLLIPTMGG
jgi:MoaD family protein